MRPLRFVLGPDFGGDRLILRGTGQTTGGNLHVRVTGAVVVSLRSVDVRD